MASKQLGRLRQWAGEKISTREKVTVNEEFLELEKDVELRRLGIQRLMTASEGYQHVLSKKKMSEAFADGEKMIPIDSLGLVMITHGEEYSQESQFGNALVKFGRAHCKIATLQEAYALTFKDTFIHSLDKFKDEIKEFESLKKKLENRRIICDTTTAKFEKLQNTKKEKDKREAEDEMERAKQRYEETAEDMRAHMHAIQENEHNQLHELTSFLDLEMNFVQSYLDILKDVKADWQDRSDIKRHPRSISGDNRPRSIRPSSKASFVQRNGKDRAESTASTLSSSDDEGATTPGRPFSNRHSRSGSTASKPPSRPASRLSRKRTNSTAASAPLADEKEKETKDTSERLRRMSVAGWASSAVESVTGSRGTSKKSKDKDSFAALDDGPAPGDQKRAEDTASLGHKIKKSSSFRGSFRNKSKESLAAQSPQPVAKILKPPSLDRKVVRALYDFSGSSDELSFKAGSDILVINEVLDDWWMGELPDGKRGLFPTSYTVPADGNSKPALSSRPYKNGTPAYLQPILYPGAHNHDNDHGHDHYLTSDVDDEQIIRAVPMAANKSPAFYGGFDDRASFAESAADSMAEDVDIPAPARLFNAPPPPAVSRSFSDDDTNKWFAKNAAASTNAASATTISSSALASLRNLMPLNTLDPAQQPLISRTHSAETPLTATHESGLATPTKKIPPPPPPRRAISHNPTTGPPIPERRIPTAPASIASSGSLLSVAGNGSGNGGGQGYDRSPFDSAVDLSTAGDAKCTQFRQNPFKPKGMCSNCLEFHD